MLARYSVAGNQLLPMQLLFKVFTASERLAVLIITD